MKKITIYFSMFIYLILFVFTMRLHTFKLLPGTDTGVFLYIGELVSENKIPYKDSWDHKPPLIYFLNGLLFKFFPKESITIAIFECLWIIVSIIIFYFFAKNLWDSKVAYITTILFALYFSNMSFAEFFGMTETYQVLFAILTIFFLYYGIKTNSILFILFSGFFASFSFLFRQTGVAVIFPVLLYIFISDLLIKRKIYMSFIFFLGFIMPVFAVFVYFFINNSLSEFISQVFVYNFFYINLLKGSFFSKFTDSFLFKRPILLYLTCGGILVFLIKGFTDNSYIKKNILFFVFLVWLLSDYYFISLSKRYYNHYMVQMIPAMALLSGFFFDYILKNTRIYISIILIIVMFILSGSTSNMEYAIRFSMKNKNNKNLIKLKYGSYTGYYHEIVDWILKNSEPNDYIYFIGTETKLNFVTKRKSPTKYTYIYPLINYKYAKKQDFEIFYNNLNSNKPKYIIDFIGLLDTNADYEKLEKFLQLLSSFGYDKAIPIYFDKIFNLIDNNYKFCGLLLNNWKIYKLKK
ncbi:MAG: glycosyltransferase family 39 protein [Candidatus Goldbacteria bacterium]|nr:glycosyltransferase family 39 protein [Candidatus Goldiibacteriota bacterium]